MICRQISVLSSNTSEELKRVELSLLDVKKDFAQFGSRLDNVEENVNMVKTELATMSGYVDNLESVSTP